MREACLGAAEKGKSKIIATRRRFRDPPCVAAVEVSLGEQEARLLWGLGSAVLGDAAPGRDELTSSVLNTAGKQGDWNRQRSHR